MRALAEELGLKPGQLFGSVRVAEKVGFVRQDEELYWVGSFGDDESV